MKGAPRSFNQWFNTSAVAVPRAGIIRDRNDPGKCWGDPGNAPKVNFYLPGDTNFDTGAVQEHSIEHKVVVQFRLETYNTSTMLSSTE